MALNQISTATSSTPTLTKILRRDLKLANAQAKRQSLTTSTWYRPLHFLNGTHQAYVNGIGGPTLETISGSASPTASRPWKTTPNILSGLWRSTYTGYYGDNPINSNDADVQWFDTQTPTETIAVADFSFTTFIAVSAQWLGYFRAPHTANYTFNASGSDDELYFWIGDKAITGYTATNADVYAHAVSDSGRQVSNPIALTAGEYYPIRLQWGNTSGGGGPVFAWEDDFGPPAPVTQDLILFFDTARTDCYPGTDTTIYNIVDLPTQTPSTLFGNVTFSNGILRIHNEDTPNPNNRVSGIQCQTVTGFKTISLWYKQITDSAGYYSYIIDARDGMPGGWIYDTPGNDWFGSDWGAGTMFINGGVSQSPTYTQQLNVWRNVTFVTNGTAFTDNIALFSRNNHVEGLDVEFGAVMIYSRAITEEENKHNYDQFKTRYGL